MLYFEDYEVGSKEISSETFIATEDNIIAFAKEWDCLPFHTDRELAKEYPIGELFASGVHTIAIGIKLLRTMENEEIAYVAGLGWQETQLLKPVLPGYQLKLQVSIESKRVSESKPDRGIVIAGHRLINQHGDLVASYKLPFIVLRKP